MKTLLKNAREQKGLKTREVAQLLGIDQALVSKFESGTRKPTREQVVKLAALLEIDLETIMVSWLKEKIIYEIGQDEFALKAFEVNALDYLLKPIEPKRLADAIHKLHNGEGREVRTDVEFVNNSILSENDQVFVKDGERCWFVKLSDIRLFESVGNYAKVFFSTNKPLILKSLNALEERLDEKMFFRANRKHIVNLRMIEKIEPYFNGGLQLELKGGEKIEVSRRQTVKFKEMMSL